MATTTKSIHRSTVALILPKSVPALIVYAQGVVKRMTGNASFPTKTGEGDWSQAVSLMVP